MEKEGGFVLTGIDLPTGNAIPTTTKGAVIITDISMSFKSMVVFMIKWVLASIPAIIISSLIVAVFISIAGGVIKGILSQL